MIYFEEDYKMLVIPRGLGGIEIQEEDNCEECYNAGYKNGYEKGSEITADQSIINNGCMYFLSLEDGGAVAMQHFNGNEPEGLQIAKFHDGELEYFHDWNGEEVELEAGDRLYVKAQQVCGTKYLSNSSFVVAGEIEVHGRINSLLLKYDEMPRNAMAGQTCLFYKLFAGSDILTAPELPYRYVGWYDYEAMFADCNRLTTAPELPAAEINNGAYRSMFARCHNLVYPPFILPVAEVAYQGCMEMFRECEKLDYTPILPAWWIGKSGYSNMFYKCVIIENCQIGAWYCNENSFEGMFNGCSKFEQLDIQVYDLSPTDATKDWLKDCVAEGIICNAGNAVMPQGSVPNGWIVARYYA